MNQNDINNTLHADRTLREAVSRREQKLPPMPADLNERLLKRMEQPDVKPKHSHLWLYSAIAVAAGILLLLVFTIGKNATKEPTLAEQTIEQPAPQSVHQPVPQVVIEEQPKALAAQQPVAKPVKKRKKAVTTPVEPAPVEDVDLAAADANAAPAYYPEEQDPFLVMEAQAENIRQRGLRLQEEIASLMNN